MLEAIEIDISVELGSTLMPIHRALQLGRGAIIALDTLESDPVRIYSGTTYIATGEVTLNEGAVHIRVLDKLQKPTKPAY